MNFFTADLHLFHENIIKYCDRPFGNIKHMHTTIKKRWNSVVSSTDNVYVAGDLTLEKKEYKSQIKSIINSLNGIKHFIVAPTHDLMIPRDYEEIGFTTIHYPAIQLPNGWFVGHDPALATVWPKGSIYICGHVHKLMTSLMSDTGVLMINCGVDVRDFTPISEQQIQDIIDNGEPKARTHTENSEKGQRKHLQNEGSCSRLQQRGDMCNGSDEQIKVREERWREARRTSINGGSTEKRNS